MSKYIKCIAIYKYTNKCSQFISNDWSDVANGLNVICVISAIYTVSIHEHYGRVNILQPSDKHTVH